VTDRDRRPARTAQNLHPGVKLLRERVDDAGAEAGLRLREDAHRRTNAVVCDRELPVRSCDFETDRYLMVRLVTVWERMLEGVQDELPRLTASREVTVPASLITFNVAGR
jgi:hypothetical protein